MNKKIKIFKNETKIYSGNCYVNTVIFRGRIYDEFKKVGQDGIRFSLQLSNGKERVAAQAESRTKFGEHNDTNCSRFYSYEGKKLRTVAEAHFCRLHDVWRNCKAVRDRTRRVALEIFPISNWRHATMESFVKLETISTTKALLSVKSSPNKKYSAEPAQAIRD